MTEQHADFLDGLRVVETELERVIGELDEVQDRLSIHPLNRVSLDPLQWALNKLADDLHDADSELRTARLEVASAQREASEAQQKQRDEWQDAQAHFEKWRAELGTVKAERDSLKQENDWLRQSKDAAVIEMDAARERVAELTKKVGELPAEPALGWKSWKPGHVITHRDGSSIALTGENIDNWARWHRHGWRLADPAPETYQWQVGDEVHRDGIVRKVREASGCRGKLLVEQVPAYQQWFEAIGWKLYRKAIPRLTPRHVPLDEDLPDIEPMTPQQVAEFAALTEPIDDSVGTDGEGQS